MIAAAARLASVFMALTLLLAPLGATAQQGPPGLPAYSVGEYLALRADMTRADVSLQAAEGDARMEASAVLLRRVEALIAYLNGWLESDVMPEELRAEAVGQRYVLFENLVWLHAERGDCAASRTALETLRALDAASLGEEYVALRDSAAEVAAECASPEPDLVLKEIPQPMSPWVSRGLLITGGAAIMTGAVMLGARPDESSPRHEPVSRAGVGMVAGGAGLAVAGAIVYLARPDAERDRRWQWQFTSTGVGVQF